MRGYAICTAPRTGSNFLCQLLASTGVLGRPLEYFNTIGRRTFDWPDYPDDPQAQLRAVLERGATANGVYGLKVFAYQAGAVSETAWAASLPGLRFVHLRRRDLLAQAISWVLAEQTGQYRLAAPGRPRKAVFDPDAISQRLDDIIQEQAQWTAFFARAGVRPLELVYERVVTRPQAAVNAVARLMEVAPPPSIDPAAVEVGVQRNAVNNDWRRRFLKLHAAPAIRAGPRGFSP